MKNAVKDATQKALQKRATWVLKQHNSGKTQEEIASLLGMTRQRVQQILAAERERPK